MEPSASAMFTPALFSRKAFTNQHVWSAGLFTVFNKAKLAFSFCFSCFFSSCNRTRAMNDQTALLMRKVALRHLSLRHLSPAVRRFAMYGRQLDCLCISKTLKIMGLEATQYETVKLGLLGHARSALFSTAVCQFEFVSPWQQLQ